MTKLERNANFPDKILLITPAVSVYLAASPTKIFRKRSGGVRKGDMEIKEIRGYY
ncbi:MAG: hypothetical protein AB1414_20530 [bacterium]